MSATDELRRMLDERGAKHYDGTECTYWGDSVLARRDGTDPVYRFGAHEVVDGLSVHLLRCTPEQAIEATIGRTTTRHGKHKTRWGREVPLCERCGYAIGDIRYHFCPNCGAKVVEE